MEVTAELVKICPFCGGQVVRTEVSGAGGTIAESACCWMPTELIDNYDVLAALPEPLQRLAIERKEAEYEALSQRWADDARRFTASVAAFHERHGHLEKKRKGDGLWL